MYKIIIKLLCNRQPEICEKLRQFDVKYDYLCKFDDVKLELTSNNKQVLAACVQNLYENFYYHIYADSDISLPQRLFEVLSIRKLKLSVAESLTGGLICSKIVEMAGASAVFEEGAVTYSNESKIRKLGVLQDTLLRYGAVSHEVANEMLDGLKTPCAISSTGIAGPDGETLTKKAGLVFIGVRYNDVTKIYRENFAGDRTEVREKTANYAMFYLLKAALNVMEDKIII